ncbi:MAG: hypothetical protein Kow001_21630 [Acidobacteriota bacterium]
MRIHRGPGLAGALGLTAVLWLWSCGDDVETQRTTSFRVVVLGFDGVDPDLVRQWIDHLPHLRELAETGTLTELGTTNPPESPVAWASFATGVNPGKHGIFDFLRRDPHTYFPDIGLVEVERPKFMFGIPLSRPKLTNNRKGLTFWKHLDQNGVSTINLRMPLEFPAEKLDRGVTWSGLGVPDLRGTWGTYFYLASDLTQWDLQNTEFGGRLIRLEFDEQDTAQVTLDGPIDPRSDTYRRLPLPVEIRRHGRPPDAVTIGIQDQEQTVSEGQWSDWFKFRFSVGPLVTMRGVSRFYVLETYPETRIYLMPISLDPDQPPLALSTPAGFTSQLVEELGFFKTLGWIHETWGLNEEQIDEGVFLEDLFRNMDNLEKALLIQLDRDRASLYSAVFTATDSVSHMFFRLLDPQHPRYDPQLARQYGDAILRVYRRMDEIIGAVRSRLGPDDLLLVVSDHGFHSWRKEFNTNTWLVRNGFMALRSQDAAGEEGMKKLDDMFSGGSFFPNVDWSKTQAYSLGLGHIYLNLRGREGQGVVEPGEAAHRLAQEIREKILQFRDPDTGEPVVQGAYLRDEIYTGSELEHAGDIQLTFYSGYRTSWQTALGAVPEDIVVANLKKWSGDHCASDFSDTAGIFVSNRRLTGSGARIIDIAPTIYQVFGVPLPEDLDGRPLPLDR